MAKIRCVKCGKLIEQRDFDKHIEQTHPKPTFGPAQSEGRKGIIVLISKRGVREGDGTCDNCGMRHTSVWHYKESNQGRVCLCGVCKQTVFDRSFGRIDAMDHAVTSSFETNRRRH